VTAAAIAWLVVAASLAAVAGGCGGGRDGAPVASAPAGVSEATFGAPKEFSFESLDDRPVTSAATRGTPTVLAFVTTSSLSSQAQVDFLVAMARHDGPVEAPDASGADGDRDKRRATPAVRYAIVALEPDANRELVEMYKKTLGIPFPVAVADGPTLAGAGPFGDVSAVPVTVVLDRAGRIAHRIDGRVVKSAEIRAALHGL
jgi:hypothetical protein